MGQNKGSGQFLKIAEKTPNFLKIAEKTPNFLIFTEKPLPQLQPPLQRLCSAQRKKMGECTLHPLQPPLQRL